MNNKKRHLDEEIIDQNDVVKFLHNNDKLYKKIQLSCYLEELATTKTIPFSIDKNNSWTICVSIMEGIKSIILKLYPNLNFCNNAKVIGKYNFEYSRYYSSLDFWIKGYNDDDNGDFFSISNDSFNKYFWSISGKISDHRKITMTVGEYNDFSFHINVTG